MCNSILFLYSFQVASLEFHSLQSLMNFLSTKLNSRKILERKTAATNVIMQKEKDSEVILSPHKTHSLELQKRM